MVSLRKRESWLAAAPAISIARALRPRQPLRPMKYNSPLRPANATNCPRECGAKPGTPLTFPVTQYWANTGSTATPPKNADSADSSSPAKAFGNSPLPAAALPAGTRSLRQINQSTAVLER